MEFGKQSSIKDIETVDPLAERRQNMKPSEYMNWRMEHEGLSRERRDKITKEKLRITNQIVNKIKGPVTFTNEMIDALFGEGGVSEDTIVGWTNKAMADKPKVADKVQKESVTVDAFSGLPVPKDVGIPEWQKNDLD